MDEGVGSIFKILVEFINEDFTVGNLTFEGSDVGGDDFDLSVVAQGLVVVKVVFVFLSAEEGSRKGVESEFEVIVGVVELGSKGDHVFHGTSEVGLFHLFVDLLEHQFLLSGSRSDGEGALEEHRDQKQANNSSHFS